MNLSKQSVTSLTLSCRRLVSYKNQSIDLLRKIRAVQKYSFVVEFDMTMDNPYLDNSCNLLTRLFLSTP